MNKQEFDAAMMSALRHYSGASDFNLSVGKTPQVEISGELTDFELGACFGPLHTEQTVEMTGILMGGDKDLLQSLKTAGSCDCAYAMPDGTRFRVNIFRARGSYSIVLRVLASEVPSLDRLKLPPIIEEIPKLKNGLVLVTGSTGSGKSTTLAAIVDRINSTRNVHIVTLEDPIEFAHPHKLATMNQRELGSDFGSFADGLKAALRQAPKVILVGEMRDRETVEIGLKAAETGHLVLSSLHTIDAGQTINRITGLFEIEEQGLVRSRLAQVIRYVVGQRLLPKEGGGRVAALEIMGSSLRMRDLIEQGESSEKTYYQVISDARHGGWQTFDQHILDLYAEETISLETAKSFCSEISVVTQQLDRIRTERGEDTSGLGELQMEYTKGPR